MRIEHVAIWVEDLEKMKRFYQKYFGARSRAKYENRQKAFQSYFLIFDGDCRLELMQRRDVTDRTGKGNSPRLGWTHLALAVETEAEVDGLTMQLQQDGYDVLDGPRRTGDGYYESVIADPEGNRVEITAG